MKSEFLDIQSFVLIPKADIASKSTRDAILAIAKNYKDYKHIIGSAKMITEEKDSNAGEYSIHQFAFSKISYIDDNERRLLKATGAIVINTDLRVLVMYSNDIYQNAPIKSIIKSNEDVSEITFTQQSLNSL